MTATLYVFSNQWYNAVIQHARAIVHHHHESVHTDSRLTKQRRYI
jgi:hypothetical protein